MSSKSWELIKTTFNLGRSISRVEMWKYTGINNVRPKRVFDETEVRVIKTDADGNTPERFQPHTAIYPLGSVPTSTLVAEIEIATRLVQGQLPMIEALKIELYKRSAAGDAKAKQTIMYLAS